MPGASDKWVVKAEGDGRTALRELATEREPNWDAVCFHAQQAVEKYLKALLIREGRGFPRTHDLRFLLEQVSKDRPDWRREAEDLSWLSFLAVEVRYPGEAATQENARRAVEIMQRWRSRLRSALGLSE
jgi:HEPN domain-containing protein